jgi:hypothetical protein
VAFPRFPRAAATVAPLQAGGAWDAEDFDRGSDAPKILNSRPDSRSGSCRF